ncbi:MAG: GtrA family protein [Xylophilus ampelinus]
MTSARHHLSLSSAGRFLLVGGSATAMHYAVMAFVLWRGWAGPVAASAAGFVLSAVFNYVASASYTFRGRHRHVRALPRFAATLAAGCALNAGVVALLLRLGAPLVLAQLVATGCVMVWNYAIHAVWTFRPPAPAPAASVCDNPPP